jgi:acetate kinase
VLWLIGRDGLTAADVSDGLEHRAGLAGLSGVPTGDLRDVMTGADGGDAACRLAVDVYIHRLRRETAAMVAALGGLDVLVFTGGIGEHQPRVREAAVAGLAFLGLALDDDANRAANADADITARGAAARTIVVTAGEEIEIARQVRGLLGLS